MDRSSKSVRVGREEVGMDRSSERLMGMRMGASAHHHPVALRLAGLRLMQPFLTTWTTRPPPEQDRSPPRQ